MTDAAIRARLLEAARQAGTPCYVYDAATIDQRFERLRALFGQHFGISYAVKANPNIALLRHILPQVVTFDISSYKEVERALDAGCPPDRLTFSGPAKRREEIERAVAMGVGELVLESLAEADMANAAARAAGRRQPVLMRINPATMPRHFGVNMAGKPSQFGIDEEECEAAIDHVMALDGLELIGFHIYSGTNSLNAEAIVENFGIFMDIFRKAVARAGIRPRKLVMGSGFGIPYFENEPVLDIEAVAAGVLPLIAALKGAPEFADAACVLEMGRWLVGPAGWLLTGVVLEKDSRGTALRACDAGFNNHLAACGMMGSVIRRNWPIENLSNPEGERRPFTLVGPLCTTIDILATGITMPEVRMGDILAVPSSGAYGLTASPTRFISHPEPVELLLDADGGFTDITESHLNHWRPRCASPDAAQGA